MPEHCISDWMRFGVEGDPASVSCWRLIGMFRAVVMTDGYRSEPCRQGTSPAWSHQLLPARVRSGAKVV